jgi:succinate dehydrogenase / fumarate reductase cytochrome b subunit
VATTSLVRDGRAVRSTIFLKMLMALSGLLFVAFVLGHMYGNLKAFEGETAFNDYAEHLRAFGEPILPRAGFLSLLRAGLLVALVVHVYAAVTLWARAKHARSTPYVMKKRTGATWASLMMRWGGVTLLLFLIWHLLNFSVGKVNVTGGPTNNPYELLVDTFSSWWLTLIYLAAMAMLGAHLHHGFWSAFQTLGWTGTARARSLAKSVGFTLALIIAVGFSLVPLAVLAGIIEK